MKFNFTKTIGFRVGLINALAIIPLLLFLFLSNSYSMDMIRDKIISSREDYLSTQANDAGKELVNIERDVRVFAFKNTDMAAFGALPSGNAEYAMAVQRIRNRMNEEIVLYDAVETVMVYEETNDRLLVCSKNSQRSYNRIYKLSEISADLSGPLMN